MESQISWLDLLAANMAGFLWIWGVISAVRWVRTEESKFFPAFGLVVLLGLGIGLFTYRASHWFDLSDHGPAPIVPEAAIPAPPPGFQVLQ